MWTSLLVRRGARGAAATARGPRVAGAPLYAAAAPAPAPLTASDARRQLRAGIEYEASRGFVNAEGRAGGPHADFGAFLSAAVARLGGGAEVRRAAAAYATLAAAERDTLLRRVCAELVDAAAAPAAAAAAPAPATARAARVAPAAPRAAEPLAAEPLAAPPPPLAAPPAPPAQLAAPWAAPTGDWASHAAAPFAPPRGARPLAGVVFDFETTGFFGPAGAPHPVELAALGLVTGRSFSTLIRPPAGALMTPQAAEKTGITDEVLAAAGLPEFAEVYARLLRFMEEEAAAAGAGALPALIGHNINKFDVPVLLAHAEAGGLPPPRDARVVDTLLLVEPFVPPGKGTRKLSALFEATGRKVEEEHRALADVRMNAAVLHWLLERGGAGGLPLAEALALPLPSLGDCGYVGDAMVGGVAGVGASSGAAAGGRRASALTPRAAFGAGAGGALEESALAAVAADDAALEALAAAGVDPYTDDDPFSAAAWAADDPLALFEAEARAAAGAAAGAATGAGAAAAAARSEWAALVADPARTRCLLTTPVGELRGAGDRGFTSRMAADLEAAGLPTLADALHNFPRGYSAAAAGTLPEAGEAAAAGEQAVCLAVTLERVAPKVGNGFAVLNATLRVLPPSALGLPAPPGGEAAYAARAPRLVVSAFRRGRFARSALSHAEAALRKHGAEFVVAAAVVPYAPGRGGAPMADAWEIKEGTAEFIAADSERARALFAGAATPLSAPGGNADAEASAHIRVAYSARGRLAPARVGALTDKALRVLALAAGQWEDPLPEWLRRRYALAGYLPALRALHAPRSEAGYEAGRRRLAFQELLVMQLKLLLQRAALRAPRDGEEADAEAAERGHALGDWRLAAAGEAALPYALTGGQRRALEAVAAATAGGAPAMALIQGDVGCGKTAVALLAALAAVGSGRQAAVMAPTEVLAAQHFRTVTALVEAMRAAGVGSGDGTELGSLRLPRVALLTGSTKRAERAAALAGLADGSVDLAVGTHALLSAPVAFARLGLAVIDEQHKFGVGQRGALLAKAVPPPHVLSMSATPIPRSLALVAHGELALVTIDELPPGRAPVATRVVPDTPAARAEVYARLREEIAAGGQAYIVCPVVGDGKAGAATKAARGARAAAKKAAAAAAAGVEDFDAELLALEAEAEAEREGDAPSGEEAERELRAVVGELERLEAEGVLARGQAAVLHGRLAPEEKAAALRAFTSGATPVLISTTVVEVGVDVPAASLIVVEHADRFGLAQLHQLRGRVGRGGRPGSAFLVTDRAGPELERLRVLERTSSGFAVAEADFAARGAGELLGRRQSGRDALAALRAARLPGDAALLERAREAAALLLARGGGRPDGWPRELLAAVADPALVDLDLAELPAL